MAKSKTETILLNKPEYDSNWIKFATELIDEYDYYEKFLVPYSANQLEIILKAEKYNKAKSETEKSIDITSLLYANLNATQMELRFTALKFGVPTEDVIKMINKSIPYATSNYIVQAYLDGKGDELNKYIDYNNIKYDTDQIYEIYAGLHNNVDISIYADPDISAETMGIIRHALEVGVESVKYNKETKKITIIVE